jgi:hypothetical protein
MLYPIELRLHEEQVNKSPFVLGVKPDFCERRRFRSVVLGMKALKPDSLLPFAIAAILGFLVLGLNGGGRPPSEAPRGPKTVETVPVDEVKTLRGAPDLRVQMKSLPSRAHQQ